MLAALAHSVQTINIEENMLLKGNTKRAYDWFMQRLQELDSEKASKNGMLARHDWWRYSYYKQPYLLLEDNETIIERFTDVFTNSLEISDEGKISVTPMVQDDQRLAQLFTELIEETNWRGVLNQDSMSIAREQIQSYFENGTPIGVQLFEGIEESENHNWLLKFSKKKYVQEMYTHGRFRISPASEYAKGSHIRAVKDLETVRSYRLKAISEILKDNDNFEFQGEKFHIENGVVPVEFVMSDYFLFCTCKEISRRMPTDFESNAVLIIKDKKEFIARLETELLISYPDWEFLEGDVYYYDPYHDLPTDRNQEFYKHLSYTYQKEHRCIIRPKKPEDYIETLEPFFIELGSLSDISEMLYINSEN